MKISVIGLGYVGLPLAILAKSKGHDVIGIDTNKQIVKSINERKSHINDPTIEGSLKNHPFRSSVNYSLIKDREVIVVCVPTPIDKNYRPNLKPLILASESLSKVIKKNQLVIIESTIYPGTCEEVILPILEKSGLVGEKDFFLAHCPERINPGDLTWNLTNIPRVVGGLGENSLRKAAAFYSSLVSANLTQLSSLKAAEAVKILENTFRDVNIAFINEMAMSFDKMGVDIIEVIKGASTKPFAFMTHYPGCGVGGHCIGVDPYYIIEKAKSIGFDHRFLILARKINQQMPSHTVESLQSELNDLGFCINGARIGLLGLAYKANVDDIRESPAVVIFNILKKKKAHVVVYDPYLPKMSDVSSLSELLKKVDFLLLATDHAIFKTLNAKVLKENNIKLVIDGRNCLSKEALEKEGIRYKGIGR